MSDSSEFDEEGYLQAFPDVAAAVDGGAFASGYEHYQQFGQKEGRMWPFVKPLTREGKILHAVNKSGRGLEIGPSYNPVAPKKKGYRVHILDHMSQEELCVKYTGHGVDVDNIEEVDFVWKGEPIAELVGNPGTYDWIIASHVIEHIPDPISFFRECEKLLSPDGVLSLVVPDKNYCFDVLNQASSTGQFLDAYQSKNSRPSPGQVFDHFANACKRDSNITWADPPDPQAKLEFVHSMQQALDLWRQASTSDIYIDTHCWRFSPESFRLLVSDLQFLGLTGMGPVCEFDTSGCEFYVTLGSTTGTSANYDRLSLLRATMYGKS